jgi:hypothetical protein
MERRFIRLQTPGQDSIPQIKKIVALILVSGLSQDTRIVASYLTAEPSIVADA